MAGVSTEMGGPSQVDTDFRAIYEGGHNFLLRAQTLAQLKADQEIAFANLRVGQDARAALEDAQRKQTEAAAALDEANRTLAQAQQSAAETIQKAKEQAGEIINSAQIAAGATINESSVIKSDAETYARKAKAEADEVLRVAADTHSAAASANAAALAALGEHQDAKKAHEDGKAHADFLADTFRRKIEALHAAVEEVKES